MRLADLCEENGLVFPNKVGRTMSASNLAARSFKPLLKRAGLPGTIRVHDPRDTCAALLFTELGHHPKKVQELLGQANICITLDAYSHALPGMGDAAAGAMDDALG